MMKWILPAVVPLFAAVVVLWGTMWAVEAELRRTAAIKAYAKYVNAVVLSARVGATQPKSERVTKMILAGSDLILHGDSAVIQETVRLNRGGYFKCDNKNVKGFKPMHEVLMRMRTDIGQSNLLSIEETHMIFCNVGPSNSPGTKK